ncbi:hypothetical protein LWI29_018214 [Acer saccharum]|uniref:CDT1 Geminin-binding domain-containing protein n=1 Tax=Acer saccharum TaxID=4024 RepID=A0AA39RVA3_ACESA|nr:hypothetical protein LWI29_018214 [Acer saccharum]
MARQKADLLPSPTHQSSSKPTHASTKLPEKYRQLCDFFYSLDSAIRLLKLKSSMSTFTNISPKIECLTDRRFSYSDLAQLKFLLPEAIEIKKVLMFDVKTSCMKPDLLVSIDVDVIECDNKLKSDSKNMNLRKVFHARLMDFLKDHPEINNTKVMASLFLATSVPKFSQLSALVIRNPRSSRVFVPIRHIQASSKQGASGACDKAAEAAKKGANAAKEVGQDVKNQATSVAENATQKTKDVAGKVSETAQDITEKAKQTVQDAWGSVKDTTQKIKDTVAGKAEESKDSLKEGANKFKRDINA